jgi:hypothetical protein
MMRARMCVLAGALALGACGADTDAPPPEFGPLATTWFGCPSLQGVYAWPPVAGEHARVASNRRAWEDGRPIFIHGPAMQIWVDESNSSRIVFHGRTPPAGRAPGDLGGGGWSFAEYHRGQYRCKGSVMEVDDDVGVEPGEGAKPARHAFRLARMQDGALAVGIYTFVQGGEASLFSYDSATVGKYKVPDRTFWTWSKLARTAPAGKPPAGAGQ